MSSCEYCETNEHRHYYIIRMYKDENRKNRIIKRNVTLAEAKAHCSREDTIEKGVWFDAWDEK